MAEAASVTFYALLALFPAIASLISLYGLVTDPASIARPAARTLRQSCRTAASTSSGPR